jgi:hypothetical protein
MLFITASVKGNPQQATQRRNAASWSQLNHGSERRFLFLYHCDDPKIHSGTEANAVNEFIAKYRNQITGVLSRFDRLVERGNLQALCGLPGTDLFRNRDTDFHKL